MESRHGIRLIKMNEFFLGYRKTALEPGEILSFVSIPFTSELQFTSAFKQAKRRDDDIAIANAGFSITLAKVEDRYVIKDSCFAYGGLGATTLAYH